MIVVLMINMIIIVSMVSDDSTVVHILVGCVVVASLGSWGCWGGNKAYFQIIVVFVKPPTTVSSNY